MEGLSPLGRKRLGRAVCGVLADDALREVASHKR
jgi:hypothetical protein